MTAFNGNRNTTEALPAFGVLPGSNDGRPWVLASQYRKDNFLSKANLRTKIKNKEIFAFRFNNRIFVKENIYPFG